MARETSRQIDKPAQMRVDREHVYIKRVRTLAIAGTDFLKWCEQSNQSTINRMQSMIRYVQ